MFCTLHTPYVLQVLLASYSMAYFNVEEISLCDCCRKSLIVLHIKMHALFITEIDFFRTLP